MFTQVNLVLSSLMLAAVVSAFPQSPEFRAAIVSQDSGLKEDGSLANRYEFISIKYIYIFF